MGLSELGKAHCGRRPAKRNKALDMVKEQYQQLKEKVPSTCDIQQRNVIYRRMINLLGVMQFLNSEADLSN